MSQDDAFYFVGYSGFIDWMVFIYNKFFIFDMDFKLKNYEKTIQHNFLLAIRREIDKF